MYNRHVPRERIVLQKCLLLCAQMTADPKTLLQGMNFGRRRVEGKGQSQLRLVPFRWQNGTSQNLEVYMRREKSEQSCVTK